MKHEGLGRTVQGHASDAADTVCTTVSSPIHAVELSDGGVADAEPVVGPKEVCSSDLSAVVGQDVAAQLVDGVFEAQGRGCFGVA